MTTTTETASEAAEGAGRLGLAVRGVMHILVAVLAAQLALGARTDETDQDGALHEVATKPFGTFVLLVLALGFAGYAVWRVAKAVRGEERSDDPSLAKRLADAGRAAINVAMAGSAVGFIVAGRESRSQGDSGTEQAVSARVMEAPGGRYLVGAVGLAVIAGGLWLVKRGLSKDFRDHLDLGDMGRHHRWVVDAGVAGHLARGIAFVVVGGFVVRAAVRFDPQSPVGLDAALHELAAGSLGRALLIAVAAGLAAFGVFSLAEARWRTVLE